MRLAIAFLMGLFSGIPLLLTKSTLSAWLTEEGFSLSMIGVFALLGTPYSLKFLWAPVLDRYGFLGLGRRRFWMMATQVGLVLGLIIMGSISPKVSIGTIAIVAFSIAFLSATQDTAIDAFRRETLSDAELSLGTSLYATGYRMGMLISGALALYLAESMSWNRVYQMMAVIMSLGIVLSFIVQEPKLTPPRSMQDAIVEPLRDFFSRKSIWIILIFVLLYKVGDNMASQMLTPFYLKSGYSKTEIALVAKTYGMVATIVGGLLGGGLVLKWGLKRSLFLFGILQMVSTAGFSYLSMIEHHLGAFAAVVSFENLASGLGAAATGGFLAGLTNKKFTATQYSLLTSLAAIPRDILAAPTGLLAESLGFFGFFILCAVVAIPGIYLIKKVPLEARV